PTPTSAFSTLSLHDALPISVPHRAAVPQGPRAPGAAARRGAAVVLSMSSGTCLLGHVHGGRWFGGRAWGGPEARGARRVRAPDRSEEHTSELQSRENLVCRL